MRKRLYCLVISLCAVLMFALPAFADNADADKRISDARGTFTSEQISTLSQKLNDMLAESDACGVIMISDSFESISLEQAETYCNDNGFSDHDLCVAMVYSFETNDIYVYSINDKLGALESSTLAYFEYDLYSDYSSYNSGVFSNEAIFSASDRFCTELSEIAASAKSGTPVTADFFNGISGTEAYEETPDYSGELPEGVINENELTRTIPENRLVPRLVDDADLLTDSQEEKLLKKLDEISDKHELDVIIVTKQSIGSKTSTQYADDYYDYNGCGYGPDDDGILFLISMENRDWAISTYGKGIKYFTDAGQEYMKEFFLPKLKSGDYNGAFHEFATKCDEFCVQAETGEPYDVGNLPRPAFSLLYLVTAVVVALVIAFCYCTYHKKQLLSVAFKKGAADYFRPGSFNLSVKNDIFLYKNVSKVYRPPSSSSGGGRGGSSTHHSSSGRSHGGSHGHF